MKRVFAMLLAAVMLLSLCACGKSEDEVKGEVSSGGSLGSAVADSTTQPEATEEPQLQTGLLAGGHYENSFIGIGCELDESWTYLGQDELAELIGITADMFQDEDYAEAVKEANMFYDMYAATADGMQTINILLQNLGMVYGTVLSEEEYLEISTQSLAQQLGDIGFSDIQWEKASISFAGKERIALKISSNVQGLDYYCTQVYIKSGSYMAVVTLASYVEDTGADIAEHFFAVEG